VLAGRQSRPTQSRWALWASSSSWFASLKEMTLHKFTQLVIISFQPQNLRSCQMGFASPGRTSIMITRHLPLTYARTSLYSLRANASLLKHRVPSSSSLPAQARWLPSSTQFPYTELPCARTPTHIPNSLALCCRIVGRGQSNDPGDTRDFFLFFFFLLSRFECLD
jgi:hypothetical protein